MPPAGILARKEILPCLGLLQQSVPQNRRPIYLLPNTKGEYFQICGHISLHVIEIPVYTKPYELVLDSEGHEQFWLCTCCCW